MPEFSEQAISPPPLSKQTIEQASLWMARMWSDNVSDVDKQELTRWRAQSPSHEFAWQQLQSIQQRFSSVPNPKMSRKVLVRTRRKDVSRRSFLCAGAVLTSSLYLSKDWFVSSAETGFATVAGEIQKHILSDGTKLAFNSNARAKLIKTELGRTLYLEQGEVVVESGSSPLTVSSQYGSVAPIGTVFSVKKHDTFAETSVYQGKVRVTSIDGFSKLVEQGSQLIFDATGLQVIQANNPFDLLWVDGKLLAKNEALHEFAARIGNYRRGYIHVAKEVAELRITGVFSTQDVDNTLANLTNILPIELHYRTPLWVSIQPRR